MAARVGSDPLELARHELHEVFGSWLRIMVVGGAVLPLVVLGWAAAIAALVGTREPVLHEPASLVLAAGLNLALAALLVVAIRHLLLLDRRG